MKIWAGYTNHRGVFNPERPIVPLSIRFGTSQWHSKPQWLMLGVDVNKGENREFATADMQEVRPSPTWLLFTLDTFKQVVTRLDEIARTPMSGNHVNRLASNKDLAEECLALLSKDRKDETPTAYPPADILYVPATDAFTAPSDITGPLGIHPRMAMKFAYMARAAGVQIDMSAEAELAFVQWQALQCWLKDRGRWRELFQDRYNDLVVRAREISLVRFQNMTPEASNIQQPEMPYEERVIAELAIMKLKSQPIDQAELERILPTEAQRLIGSKEDPRLPAVEWTDAGPVVTLDVKEQGDGASQT